MSDTQGFGPISPVVMSAFLRAGGAGTVSLVTDVFTLPLQASVLAQLGHGLDGACVSVPALQAMGRHPVIYLAEHTITGILKRPDLYTIDHPDSVVKAAVEAWLWPLLPRLAAAACRAFAYGSVPVRLTIERGDLRIRVLTKDGTKERWRTVAGHTRYVRAQERRPDHVDAQVDVENELVSLRDHDRGDELGADAAHVFRWDPEFDSWAGQGARRRAWRDWCEYLINTMLETLYLERSVDAPRIARSPDGETEVNGVKYENRQLMEMIAIGLRGSGVASLPGKKDAAGNWLFDLGVLNLPERGQEWDRAIGRRAANLFLAYLVAPQLAGVDSLPAGAGKTLDGMIREFVENLATWVAVENLQKIVERVHRWNYGASVETPTVCITDVGKANAKKTLLDVLGLVNAAGQGEISWRTDVPAALDRLGIPLRDVPPPPFDQRVTPPAAGAPGGGPKNATEAAPPGRPRDPTGQREQRRQDAQTTDGEDATGAEGEGQSS